MRDPVKIRLKTSSVEPGQVLKGQVILSEKDVGRPIPKISLAVTTTYQKNKAFLPHALAQGILQDQDMSPGADLSFEIDITPDFPLSWGRTRIVLEADWLENESRPALQKINVLPDSLWQSLWKSCASLGLEHTLSSGILAHCEAGPLASQVRQIFSLQPLDGHLVGSLTHLNLMLARTETQNLLHATANQPSAYLTTPGDLRQATLSLRPEEQMSPSMLSNLISEALLA